MCSLNNILAIYFPIDYSNSLKQKIVISVKANMNKVEIVEGHQSVHEQNQRILVF